MVGAAMEVRPGYPRYTDADTFDEPQDALGVPRHPRIYQQESVRRHDEVHVGDVNAVNLEHPIGHLHEAHYVARTRGQGSQEDFAGCRGDGCQFRVSRGAGDESPVMEMSRLEVLSSGAEVGLLGRVGSEVNGPRVGLDRLRGPTLSPEQIGSSSVERVVAGQV